MFAHLTYLVFELGWALPVLALQWAVGWRVLWDRRAALGLALVVPTVYLCCADGVAIATGIWAVHAGRTLGLRIGDVPIEEVIFFSVTNAMVVQSVLLLYPRSRRVSA